MTAAPYTAYRLDMTFDEAAAQLRRRGVILRMVPGAYAVNFRNGKLATEYLTDDFNDAVAYAFCMGEAPPVEPPLGPVGTKRGEMYAHNRRVAARRRKQQAQQAARSPLGDEPPPEPCDDVPD